MVSKLFLAVFLLCLLGLGYVAYRTTQQTYTAFVNGGWMEGFKLPRGAALAFGVRCAVHRECPGKFKNAYGILWKENFPYPAWTLGLLLLPLLGAGIAGVADGQGFRKGDPDAHWAKLGELRSLIVKAFSDVSIQAVLLGYYPLGFGRKKLLAIKPTKQRSELGHGLAVGPPRAGKGLHLVHNLLNWRGSAIVLDIKGELFDATAGYRSRFSEVFRLDPGGTTHRFDPFERLEGDTQRLYNVAETILNPSQDGDDAVFAESARGALVAALRAAYLLEEASLPYLKRVMAEGPLAFVKKVAEVGDEEVRESLIRFTGRPPSQLPDDHFDKRGLSSGAWGTLQARVAPLLTPGVLDLMSGFDFNPLQFYHTPTTLYLVFRESEAKATRAAFELILLSLVGALCDWADSHRNTPKIPILVALDEAGAVRIPDLERLISTSAGRHISLWLYVQSLGQLQTFYGKSGAQTILDGTYTKLFYPSQDLETWKHVSEMVGETSVEDKRTAKPQRWGATRTVNEGKKSRRLITPDQVGRLKPHQLIAFVGNHPAILGVRLDWRTHKKLRPLTLLPPPSIKRPEALPEAPMPPAPSPLPEPLAATDYREPEV